MNRSMLCRLCHRATCESVLRAGRLPVSNGYVAAGQVAPVRDLHLGRCPACDLFQLIDPFAAQELAAQVPPWVRYGEPESHLDDLCGLLAAGLTADASIGGVSYVDETLVRRFRDRGFALGAELDHRLGAAARSLEETLVELEAGVFPGTGHDLIVARQILDHARCPDDFLRTLHAALAPGGRLLIEVPSSRASFEQPDPLLLWESHANFFTAGPLERALERNGFGIEWSRALVADRTAVLVVVGRKVDRPSPAAAAAETRDVPPALVRGFVEHVARRRERLHARCGSIRAAGGRIALYGAGHVGSLFLNLFDLGPFFEMAIDDDPRKLGLLLPGSGLPIRPLAELGPRRITDLVLSVHPRVEAAVVARIRDSGAPLEIHSLHAASDRGIAP